jgi:hypothetical protein
MFLLFLLNSKRIYSYKYFVDPVSGNDSNAGNTPIYAKKTTSYFDTVSLSGTQSVGYKYNGTWVLYRKKGITMDEILLPMSLIGYTMDSNL